MIDSVYWYAIFPGNNWESLNKVFHKLITLEFLDKNYILKFYKEQVYFNNVITSGLLLDQQIRNLKEIFFTSTFMRKGQKFYIKVLSKEAIFRYVIR